MEMVLQLILVIFAIYQLEITFFHPSKTWKKWTFTTYIEIIIVIAGLARILCFGLDADLLIPRIPSNIVFNITNVMWLSAAYLLALYWIELLKFTGIKIGTAFLTKTRPVLIFLVVITALIFIPLGTWCTMNATVAWVYNFLLAFDIVIMVVLFAVLSYRLSKVYKTEISNEIVKKFFKKLNLYIWFVCGAFLSMIITLIIYTLLNASFSPWPYLILSTILRIEEFIALMATLLFLAKKRPSKSKGSETNNTKNSTQNESLSQYPLV